MPLSIKYQIRILAIIDALLYKQRTPGDSSKKVTDSALAPVYFIIAGNEDKRIVITKDARLEPDRLHEGVA